MPRTSEEIASIVEDIKAAFLREYGQPLDIGMAKQVSTEILAFRMMKFVEARISHLPSIDLLKFQIETAIQPVLGPIKGVIQESEVMVANEGRRHRGKAKKEQVGLLKGDQKLDS